MHFQIVQLLSVTKMNMFIDRLKYVWLPGTMKIRGKNLYKLEMLMLQCSVLLRNDLGI